LKNQSAEKWLKINIRTGLIHSEKPKTKNNNDETLALCVWDSISNFLATTLFCTAYTFYL